MTRGRPLAGRAAGAVVPSHQPICCIRVRMRALTASMRWGVRVRGAGSTAAS